MPFGAPMVTLDRRSFLSSLAVAGGVAAAPAWLARAMLPQDPVSDWREKALRAAVAKAKDEGKPLLVFVAPLPADKVDGFTRGQWLGAWLNHGGTLATHAIAMCVVACASLDELARVTGTARVEGQPVMVLADVSHFGAADAQAPKLTAVTVELGAMYPTKYDPDPEKAAVQRQQHLEAGLEKITAALQDGLNRHGASVARLASDVTARLSAAQRGELTAWLAGGAAPADALIARATAEVRRAAGELADAPRARVLERLTQAIDLEVVKKRVAGARWQKPGGCGAEFEEPTPEEKTQGIPACGMGRTPPLCERFLNFYSVGA
jgi:hypothetical protein